MAWRLVNNRGGDSNPVVISVRASGTVKNGQPVDLSRVAGQGVYPSANTSSSTTIFGICLDYAQGASDVEVKVIPFHPGQLWEVDCAQAALTAQVGIRHAINNVDRSVIHNTSTDVSNGTGIFRAVAMVGSTSGSGKLIGFVTRVEALPDVASATVNQY